MQTQPINGMTAAANAIADPVPVARNAVRAPASIVNARHQFQAEMPRKIQATKSREPHSKRRKTRPPAWKSAARGGGGRESTSM